MEGEIPLPKPLSDCVASTVSKSPQSPSPSLPGHPHVCVGCLQSLIRIFHLNPSCRRPDWRQLTDVTSTKPSVQITYAQVSRFWSGVNFGRKPLFSPLQYENVFYSYINWWHTHLEGYPTLKVCPALRCRITKLRSAVNWQWMSYLMILTFIARKDCRILLFTADTQPSLHIFYIFLLGFWWDFTYTFKKCYRWLWHK